MNYSARRSRLGPGQPLDRFPVSPSPCLPRRTYIPVDQISSHRECFLVVSAGSTRVKLTHAAARFASGQLLTFHSTCHTHDSGWLEFIESLYRRCEAVRIDLKLELPVGIQRDIQCIAARTITRPYRQDQPAYHRRRRLPDCSGWRYRCLPGKYHRHRTAHRPD
jgi:hypothetical protein